MLGGFLLLGATLLAAAAVFSLSRREEEEMLPVPEETEPEGIVDATIREAFIWWAGEANWHDVRTGWINEWPGDTDVRFAWKIRNTGTVSAYFQVYMFDPGEWLYLEPDGELVVYEDFHTPAVPVAPDYESYRITILGRKLDGERVGDIFISNNVEVTYS